MGNYKIEDGTDLKRVNPQLLDIVKNAIAQMPYDAIITSGGENRGSGELGNHGPGHAIDVAFIGPDGKRIGNKGSTGGTRAAPIYEQYAQLARAYQMQKYPKLADVFRWGGGFRGGGTPFDYMHLDITPSQKGAMGYYDWETGWKPEAFQAMPGLQKVALMPFGQSGGALQIKGPSTALTAAAPIPATRPAAVNAIDTMLNNAAVTPALNAFTRTNDAAKAQPAPAVASPITSFLGDALKAVSGNVYEGVTSAFSGLSAPKTPVKDGQVALPVYSSASLSGTPAYPVDRSARPGGYVGTGAPVDVDFRGEVASHYTQKPDTVVMPVDTKGLIAQIKKAVPMAFMASNNKIIDEVTKGLPPYIKFDPAANTITYSNLNDPQVAADLAAGPNTGNPKVDAIFKPIADKVVSQGSIPAPVPLPRTARPTTSSSQASAPSYTPPTPWATLAAQAKPAPAPAPKPQISAPSYIPPTPWATLAAQAKPAPAPAPVPPKPVLTPALNPWAAMAAAGPMGLPVAPAVNTYGVTDPLGAVERGWAANPAAMAAKVAANLKPVVRAAPPVIQRWTTSSRIPYAPPVPQMRPGATPAAPASKGGLFGLGGGLLGLGGGLTGLVGQMVAQQRQAPRGQFGQPLGVGGVYRNGAVWAADGSGYGGTPGQSTAGLKTGERVYDPNTGQWGLKVGQPVTWTGNRVDGSSAGSNTSGGGSTSGATGTFKGTSTGNTYVVGQQYVNGNGTYQAMPDGTFKRV